MSNHYVPGPDVWSGEITEGVIPPFSFPSFAHACVSEPLAYGFAEQPRRKLRLVSSNDMLQPRTVEAEEPQRLRA